MERWLQERILSGICCHRFGFLLDAGYASEKNQITKTERIDFMKTIVIVGAGKGLCLSLAKRFGKEDFQVALIARNEEKLQSMVEELNGLGVKASCYTADIYQKDQIERAFGFVKATYGVIDVLEFSPTAGNFPPTSVLELTPENVLDVFNGMVIGAINCVNLVLPDMQKRGSGTILFTAGLSAMYPIPMMGNIGIAMTGLSNYAANLSTELEPKGIHAGLMALGLFMKPGTGAANDPEVIADAIYKKYAENRPGVEAYPEGVTPATILM